VELGVVLIDLDPLETDLSMGSAHQDRSVQADAAADGALRSRP
jgi:hypothetical protein